jgi:hypothetical protein
MRQTISNVLIKISKDLKSIEPEVLTKEDIKKLNKDAIDILKTVKDKADKKDKNPLKDLSYEDKLLLLAFVIYKRQNIATPPTEDPNVEDAAKVLHNKVYTKSESKKSEDSLDKDLTKQLGKAGLKI